MSRILLGALLLICFGSRLCVAQAGLQITSPTGDQVVNAGQSIEVSAQGSFDTVLLGCDIPIRCVQTSASSGLFNWSVAVPATAPAGVYALQAVGTQLRNRADATLSNKILITVPMTTLPKSIDFDPSTPVTFRYVGEQKFIRLIATMPDGSTVDVTSLPAQTTITTTDNISHLGEVFTSNAAGQGSISGTLTVQGVTFSAQISTNTPIGLRGDLNGDGRVDIDDVNLLLSFNGRPSNGSNDARDLNNDGVINALDARILTTLCTYPRCATHQ